MFTRDGLRCGHLAYSEQSFDAPTGKLATTFAVPLDSARAENGLCGPEGILFEPHSVRRRIETAVLFAAAAGFAAFAFLV